MNFMQIAQYGWLPWEPKGVKWKKTSSKITLKLVIIFALGIVLELSSLIHLNFSKSLNLINGHDQMLKKSPPQMAKEGCS